MGRAVIALALFLMGCDGKPKHYYVFCGAEDSRGWKLISSAKDDKGYLIACTYQSPDRKEAYTSRCTDKGCA